MWFVGLGILLIAMKLGDVSVVAEWNWWMVLAPFGLAVLWWIYADSSGLTKRREMEKLENKKLERRRKNMAALGTGRDNRKTADAIARAREASRSAHRGGALAEARAQRESRQRQRVRQPDGRAPGRTARDAQAAGLSRRWSASTRAAPTRTGRAPRRRWRWRR